MYLAHHAVQIAPELVDIRPLAGRQENAGCVGPGDPAFLQIVEREILARGRRQVVLVLADVGIGVDLVEYQKYGLVAGAYLLQRLFHDGDLLLEARMRNVDHMQQQVGLAHLVQRAFERIHQVGRQFTDKTDRIRQQEGQMPLMESVFLICLRQK